MKDAPSGRAPKKPPPRRPPPPVWAPRFTYLILGVDGWKRVYMALEKRV